MKLGKACRGLASSQLLNVDGWMDELPQEVGESWMSPLMFRMAFEWRVPSLLPVCYKQLGPIIGQITNSSQTCVALQSCDSHHGRRKSDISLCGWVCALCAVSNGDNGTTNNGYVSQFLQFRQTLPTKLVQTLRTCVQVSTQTLSKLRRQ